MAKGFSNATNRKLGIAGLCLSSVCVLIIVGALATGNYDQNVASLIPTSVLGVSLYFGMLAVNKSRANRNAR